MSRLPIAPLAPEVGTGPETHHRLGRGLGSAWVEHPAVSQAVDRLRRRGAVVAVTHVDHRQHDRWRNRARTIPAVLVSLQLPPSCRDFMLMPKIRTEAGEGAAYSPSADVWLEDHGNELPWESFVAAAPEQPWSRARRTIEVYLQVTDPASWLHQLVELIDEEAAPGQAELALG